MTEAITHEIRELDPDVVGEVSAYAEIRFPAHAPISRGLAARKALGLLVRAMLEIVVQVRDANGAHAPAQAASREAEGGRWND